MRLRRHWRVFPKEEEEEEEEEGEKQREANDES